LARRAGLSLLEVILSIAILGFSMVALSGLVRVGTRAAAEARDLTKAQILCEGKMSELAAGVILPEPADQVPFELDPGWLYSVSIGVIDQQGLLMAQVIVEKEVEAGEQPISFTLTRWMIDPVLESMEDPASDAAADTASSDASGAATQSGSTSSGSVGSGGSGSQNNGN
jgi:Tfp pilus assembly protein PilV